FGVSLSAAAVGNFIGGTAPGMRNLISANAHGVALFDSNTTLNAVQGNFIGTNLFGVSPLGNAGEGVLIQEATNNLIGGYSAEAGNWIAFNGNDGVLVDTGLSNGLHGNSLFSNVNAGIELINSGNYEEPAPVITQVDSTGSSVTIQGM